MSKENNQGLNAGLAAEIRAERGAQSLTVVALAEKIGVSKSKMLAILKPSIDIDVPDIEALSNAFGIEPYELMRRAQERAKTLET